MDTRKRDREDDIGGDQQAKRPRAEAEENTPPRGILSLVHGLSEFDVIMKKIAAIATINNEIIVRVETKVDVGKYQYRIQLEENNFTVHESKTTLTAEAILQGWRLRHQMVNDRWDIFNERLNYSVDTWADLKALNPAMLKATEKFVFLDRTHPKCIEALRNFQTNFEILQTGFGEVEGLLLDDRSILAELQVQVGELNKGMQTLLSLENVSLVSNFFGSNLLTKSLERALSVKFPGNWKRGYSYNNGGLFPDPCIPPGFDSTRSRQMVIARDTKGDLIGGKIEYLRAPAFPVNDGGFVPNKILYCAHITDLIFKGNRTTGIAFSTGGCSEPLGLRLPVSLAIFENVSGGISGFYNPLAFDPTPMFFRHASERFDVESLEIFFPWSQ